MKFIAYYRVSEKHGLALNSLRNSVEKHVTLEGGKLIREFSESVTDFELVGPAFEAAVQQCCRDKAVLVLAESDPLSRQMGMLALLAQHNVPLAGASQSHANKVLKPFFTDTRPDTSPKVTKPKTNKESLRRGNPGLARARATSAEVRTGNADAFALKYGPMILGWRDKNHTLAKIAARLNDMNILGPRGGKWHSTSVSNLIERCKCMAGRTPKSHDL